MDPGYTLRPATFDDIPAIRDVVETSLRTTVAADYPPDVIEDLVAGLSDEILAQRLRDEEMFVADSPDGILGVASLGKARARLVYVRPETQGRGVGRALMRFIEGLAQRRGVTTLTVFASRTAERFYRSLGYTVADASDDEDGIAIPMEKSLLPPKRR